MTPRKSMEVLEDRTTCATIFLFLGKHSKLVDAFIGLTDEARDQRELAFERNQVFLGNLLLFTFVVEIMLHLRPRMFQDGRHLYFAAESPETPVLRKLPPMIGKRDDEVAGSVTEALMVMRVVLPDIELLHNMKFPPEEIPDLLHIGLEIEEHPHSCKIVQRGHICTFP